MSARSLDIWGLTLALGVMAVFGLYFWHVGTEIKRIVRMLYQYFEGRAGHQRQAIAVSSGPESLVRRTGQILSLTLLLAVLAYALLRKFGLL